MKENKRNEETLQLIPKTQNYIEYMIDIIIKLPRTEKFSIGNEYKQSMYSMMGQVLYINKVEKVKKIEILNKIDTEINIQRILARIMCKKHWIDTKKFEIIINKIGEIGKLVGGLIKYYGKKN